MLLQEAKVAAVAVPSGACMMLAVPWFATQTKALKMSRPVGLLKPVAHVETVPSGRALRMTLLYSAR